MAIRWRPEHCGCELVYEPDGLGPDPRWPFTGVSATTCAAHAGLTAQELVAVLHEESFSVQQTRQRALNAQASAVTKLVATQATPSDLPPVTVTWAGTGKTRVPTVTFAAALSTAEKTSVRNLLVLAGLPRAVTIA